MTEYWENWKKKYCPAIWVTVININSNTEFSGGKKRFITSKNICESFLKEGGFQHGLLSWRNHSSSFENLYLFPLHFHFNGIIEYIFPSSHLCFLYGFRDLLSPNTEFNYFIILGLKHFILCNVSINVNSCF